MLSFSDPSIGPNTGPYEVGVFFDLNDNFMWDSGEPTNNNSQIFVDNQGYTMVELDLGGGGPPPI